MVKPLVLGILILLVACKKSGTQPPAPIDFTYEATPREINLTGRQITEASGLADSRRNSGFLWVIEDSGNPPLLLLVKYDGSVNDSILLLGAKNRDWEDIVLGAGPVEGVNYLYVGDIGDNKAVHDLSTIYRLPEPGRAEDTVSTFDKIEFSYEDGPRDAEAFLIDPATRDIYLFTKAENRSRIYKLPYPQNTNESGEASFMGELPYAGVTSAALSSQNDAVIIKTYTHLYHYTAGQGESILDVINKQPRSLDYRLEVQGEAVSFGLDPAGFYTLSEAALGVIPTLNFYRRR